MPRIIPVIVTVVVAVAIGACSEGGNTSPPPDAPPDTPPPPLTCNPLAQTGCNPGEKCTWWSDQETPAIGHVGCAPDGALAIGTACQDPVAGPSGFDSCVKGSACVGGVCKAICGLDGTTASCGDEALCARYTDTFHVNGMYVAGVCDPRCDPLTQELTDGRAACGSTKPAEPNLACVGAAEHACAPSGPSVWTLTDRQAPLTTAAGMPYSNGCAPGFIPLFYEMTGSTKVLCSGLCAALDTDNTAALRDNALGSTTARAKLPTSAAAVAGDGTCAIGKKGSHASSRCQFLWPYLQAQNALSPSFIDRGFADTLGVCQAIAFFKYDADNDMTPETPIPDCANLPPRSEATPSDSDDAADWGCYRYSVSTAPALAAQADRRSPAERGGVRIPSSEVMPRLRHVLD